MISSKNITPKKLAVLNAVIVSFMVLIVGILLMPRWTDWLILFVITFITSYFFYFSTIQYFIFRKIKLIYKLIFETKASKKEEVFFKTSVQEKSIDDVRQDVEAWAKKKNIEIESLKNNEQFRKEFLMNLAHELKTPIFTTQGYIHTLLNGAIDDENVKMSFLENAAKSIDRLADMTGDIEQITNLESGLISLDKENFIIQDLLKEIFSELELFANQKQVTFTLKSGTEAPITVNADKDKIRQVLVNLLTNAVKYGYEKSVVVCSCYIIDNKKVLVEVSDQGQGIKEEHISRLFERFYRADKSRDRKVGGSGLGLSIVKHIVEAHGQTVTVRSKLNIGTTFGFTLDKG